jgi:hypothetical protein
LSRIAANAQRELGHAMNSGFHQTSNSRGTHETPAKFEILYAARQNFANGNLGDGMIVALGA